MIIEKVFDKIRYTLSNENLSVNDKVYPIARGRCLDNGNWILHDLNFSNYSSGFPDNPHTIINLEYSKYKPHEVLTNFGYSPKECYFKLIKIERRVNKGKFGYSDWVEI